MDLEGLRAMGVDYTILDKGSVKNLNVYEDISYRKEHKSHLNVSSKETRSPDEKRLLKLEINRLRMAERRANESNEERALRLYKNKMRNKVRRATETPEQRADRNRRNMERNRQRRIKQREMLAESDTQITCDGEKDISNTRPFYFINDLVRVELSNSPILEEHPIETNYNDYDNRFVSL